MNKLIWDEASEICRHNNGQLAQLDPSENQRLNGIGKVYENLWLGGQIRDTEWLWDDGSKIQQPGTAVAATTSERRCVGVSRIGPQQPVKLEAWSCSEPRGFLCRLGA
ncbi:uncharacterized protein LOC124554694 [Schistocerca americana]|uniref:uncharacterized protein LOC124554694 n=1 Tax=Schistocerca americana TaxID=7009 RepID=UPI001F4F709B|nr:uncharacterized protein LOC124554694 [Schistocerca americana]